LAIRLNWLVVGAGAIGTYIGGSLLLHGQKVVFLELHPADSELRDGGLKLNIHGQDFRILHPVVFSSLPAALSFESYDVAIFALKSYDTHTALELIRPDSTSFPPVLCLQNGVENETALDKVLGNNKVIAGTVTSAVRRISAGDIQLERLRGVGVAGIHPLSSPIVRALTDAHLNAHLYASPVAMKWSKMFTNLLVNASSAILDMPPAEILSHPGLYRVEMHQLREAIAVMHALQIQPVDLPGTPVRGFVWMVSHLPAALSQPLISRIAGKGRGQKMPSFHIDLHSRCGKSEVDYLNGAVVRFGERLNVPTPVNQWLNQTLISLTQGSLPLDLYSHNPDKYLTDLCSPMGTT
jgi:2-dehydropantoate 2-reductase